MAAINFTKMHGLGNDFVVIDCRNKKVVSLAVKAELIGDRRFGIGCDQIISIHTSRRADYRMRIINSDGSEVEMCGNGVRCFAKYLWDRNDPVIRSKKTVTVETLAGIVRPTITSRGLVKVDMGEPVLDGLLIPTTLAGEVVNRPIKVGKKRYRITAVSMGNPHAIIFTDDVEKVALDVEGSAIENCTDLFPNRVNVEFAQVTAKNRIKVRVWERGSGETLACGTGACAVAVAGFLNGKTGNNVDIDLPGGGLNVKWNGNGPVIMTGPAKEVFTGTIDV